MSAINLTEAQARLPELIASLSPGEQIQIVDRNGPVARLVREAALSPQARRPGSAKGKLVILAEDDEHLRDFGEYMP